MNARPPTPNALPLGRWLYRFYHAPMGKLRDSLRDGGPIEQRRTRRGCERMEAAAFELPAIPPQGGTPVELHLLTGARFWYQTAFCLWTFSHQARREVAPVIYDDGSLGEMHRAPLRRLFPRLRIVEKAASIARLDALLPVARFPFLRDRWTNYPNIRKLIDPHLGATGWKLIIDSDLLFFRRPDFLLNWSSAPDRPLHAVDSETSYGYDRALMNRLAGAPVADLVNVGLTGLNSDQLDWERLEFFCRELITTAGTHYYLEQALIAMLVAGKPCAIAPASDYLTLPRPPEAQACTAVMHHYVADAKKWYFRNNWIRAQNVPPTSTSS